MKLLLLSNSTNAGEEYLRYPLKYIHDFLGKEVKNVAFIPYAGVTISYDQYTEMVMQRFTEIGYTVNSVHTSDDPVSLVEEADGIVVGGGNTFQLLKLLQETGLLSVISARVKEGIPYIGWSAGSNVSCPTIQTTNDMPICQPQDFKALNLIPFQINPHFTDVNPPGFNGETRPARIKEYIEVNRKMYVVGLREGTALLINQNNIELLGPYPASVFKYGNDLVEIKNDSNINFLLE